ncbi:OmpH family outer membrane protein [Pedosphaera parvula]|uniref:Outer membrane chaperone Skp (OmpH) n=1 Tax=Pedosphaera parvula (strain Ellin514) TaxID=320771 RepID=B9XIE5_PEDPL|nr:OmpH family outer membrane protein [Pedosphaera parvula]EEF60406.1 outer membrane chaperone Skp (OmpH) [Pedosphaera parvula Ellin514]
MKTILKRILPVLLLTSLLSIPAMAESRIATIDLRKVFDNYWKRQQAEAALKDRAAEFDKEYKSMVDDYNKVKEDYNKIIASSNDQSVTQEERDKRKSSAEAKLLEIKSSENTIRAFENNARDQLDTQRKRMRDTILQEIRNAISAKAKAGGFSLVVDSAAESINNTPVVLYDNHDNDLTDGILSQLNVGAPPTATKETPAADDKKENKK